jgi:hypothetical protein
MTLVARLCHRGILALGTRGIEARNGSCSPRNCKGVDSLRRTDYDCYVVPVRFMPATILVSRALSMTSLTMRDLRDSAILARVDVEPVRTVSAHIPHPHIKPSPPSE